jgi:uncharacterized protein (TIGR02246 family)
MLREGHQARGPHEKGAKMKHRGTYLVLAAALLLGLGLYASGTASSRRQAPGAPPGPPASQDEKKTAPDGSEASKAVLANVRTFTEAFNRRDIPALLKLFTDDCDLTEADGTTVHGLKELEEELKDSFEDDPEARISVSVDMLRAVTPDVVIEEGKTVYFPDGKTATAETQYQATHVKKGGRWLMSRVRTFNRVVLSPYDQLRELEWLIGHWVDESADSLVETSYRWAPNKVFLLQDFKVRVNGENVLSGTQRIGWDPLSKHIKAWVFDSEGGYAQSLWTDVDDSWVIRVTGVRTDGQVVTMTNRLTQLDKDRMRFESADRIVAGERMPNFSTVVVRKPPPVKQP